MNSSLGDLATILMSGLQVTIVLSQLTSSLLQQKSPNPLDKLRCPLILPCCTLPPASIILFDSEAMSGLWSEDRSIELPFLQRTLRESPQFATTYTRGVISTTLAVHPTTSEIFLFFRFFCAPLVFLRWLYLCSWRYPSSERIRSSMVLKDSSSALSQFPR